MILNLPRFLETRRPQWLELEAMLNRLERDITCSLDLQELRRFHNLYTQTCSDLSQLSVFSSEIELRQHLESLIARCYGEIHETRRHQTRFSFVEWFLRTFPRTFRRQAPCFLLSCAMMLTGACLGAVSLRLLPNAKEIIMPFPHLLVSPSDRVAHEEKNLKDPMQGSQAGFSAMLMTHNTRVSILTFASGLTYGVGTLILLFYNGVILGAVCMDYIGDGQSRFLIAWLLPHGSVEIPAILIAGQAGLILAGALVGWGDNTPIRHRLRRIGSDVITLLGGLTLLLIWAGLIESFLSQYHEPYLPYSMKIIFGLTQLMLLLAYLSLCGRDLKKTKVSRRNS
ncbi:MAG: stage II sporulation protein M [Blastochloris sp.]|nr:stage II sporulation protein M [Blastochloris sp.]